MTIELPSEVVFILDKLNEQGFEAFVVGGCIRDVLMNKSPKDWDIVTSAMPTEVKGLFPRTFDTGIRHGTVTVVLKGVNYEVTTYKENNTQGAGVDLLHDLSKRDLTMNAIAYHPEKGLIDPFFGELDIEKKIIRAVENPHHRFTEDPLRMLRAMRFMAQFDFNIDPTTHEAIVTHAHKIQTVSVERIREELTKLFLANPLKLQNLKECGLLQYILPEFHGCFGVEQNHPYHLYDVARHTMIAMANAEKTPIHQWTMLLHDVGKPETRTLGEDGYHHFYGHVEKSLSMAEEILDRFKFDNYSTETIKTFIKYHDQQIGMTKKSVRRFMSNLGKDVLIELLKVKRADSLAQNLDLSGKKLEELEKIRNIIDEIEESKDCVSLKELAIKGQDLMAIGVVPGKEMGSILNTLLEMVIEEPSLNLKEELLRRARELMQKNK